MRFPRVPEVLNIVVAVKCPVERAAAEDFKLFTGKAPKLVAGKHGERLVVAIEGRDQVLSADRNEEAFKMPEIRREGRRGRNGIL